MVGEIVGSYRVVRKIGEGGMGAVYLAEHTLLGRSAAIKVLLREMSHREDLVMRFFNEARAATSVKHPGIVEVYDFGYHNDGSAYIVMEFLEGESLSMRLRRAGLLSEARAVALCRQVGGALAAAHSKGIVHRDLKPDNIFIVRDPDTFDGERTKILDFGIAKLGSDQPGQSSMTRTGMVMGTPAYMAPEQCKGAGHVDQRSDLYALGCILFEMVCGRPPFVAEGAGEVMAQHIYTPVPVPSSIAPVTPVLEQIIVRTLAKEPEHRFRSVEELLATLQAFAPSGAFAHAGSTGAMMAGPGPVGSIPSIPGPLPPVHATTPPGLIRTTMSAAAGATTATAPPVGKKRSWMLSLAVFAVFATGGSVFAVTQGRSAHDAPVTRPPELPHDVPAARPTPAHVAPAAADGAQPPPSAPSPPPTLAKTTLTISSNPTGAEVYRMPQSVRIGTTPLSYPIDATSGEVVLLLKKHGYRDQSIAMPADHGADQTVSLVRKPIAATVQSAGETPQGPSDFFTHTPAPSTGSLDPFARPRK